jgi:DNA-binding MarR family transcriptional regulator
MSSSGGRQQLLEALTRAMREATGPGVLYSAAVAARLGINSTDLECLDFVLTRGPLTAGRLAEATGLTTGAITGVIDRLERAGFARRKRDPADRRKVLVEALPAVQRQIMPLFEPMLRAAMGALADLDDRQLSLLLDFFARAHTFATRALAELHAMPAAKTKKRKSPKATPAMR